MPRGSKEINHLFAIFCRVNGFRLATSGTDDGGYALDYYQGYQIVRLSSTGGQYQPFGSRRYSVKEFAAILRFGIDLARMKEESAQQRYPGRPASQYLGNSGGTTLAAWSKKYNVRVHHSETGYKCRVFERDIPNAQAKRELYHLSDYIVSAAISGPAFALSPRTHAKTNPHHKRGRDARRYEGATYHVEVWEERDRCHIALWRRWMNEDDIVSDWWDDDARQMFEDGFFKRGRQLAESVIAYAKEVGII